MAFEKKHILLVLAFILFVVLIVVVATKKKKEKYAEYDNMTQISKKANVENYSETMVASDYDNYMVQRPNFKANLAPRFDPFRNGGGFIKGFYPPNPDMLAGGVTPLSDSEFVGDYNQPPVPNQKAKGKESYTEMDFATLGLEKSEDESYRKACNAIREDEVSKFRSAQGYSDPSQLLPTPDLRSCLKDPTDPENYMYDRTIFAPLKRRNKNDVDWIRGDLRIEPIRMGWFDSPSIPSVDLVGGAVQFFDSAVDNQATLYSRGAPVESPTLQAKMDLADKLYPMGDIQYHLPL